MSSGLNPRRALGAAWSRPAAAGAQGPRTRDVVLVIVLAAAAVLEGAIRSDLTWPFATIIVTLVILPGLLWRRSRPVIVVVATTLVTAGFEVAQAMAGVRPNTLATMLVLLAVPYAVFRWGSGRARIVGGTIFAAGLPLSVALGGEGLAGAVAGVAILGGTCLTGALRRERVDSRMRTIEAVRATEREALARDLHDSVAHHVSAIAIRAQVAAADPHDTARVSESLGVIESQAHAVLTDMRALVRNLRTSADYAPAAGLADLAGLADPGPPAVTVRVDAHGVSSAVIASTLFRIAQEGVTNARRHARAATAIDVAVTVDPHTARIVVHDDGAPANPASGDGYGLTGVSERAALLGGNVIAGPDPDGGWTLTATLPVRSAA